MLHCTSRLLRVRICTHLYARLGLQASMQASMRPHAHAGMNEALRHRPHRSSANRSRRPACPALAHAPFVLGPSWCQRSARWEAGNTDPRRRKEARPPHPPNAHCERNRMLRGIARRRRRCSRAVALEGRRAARQGPASGSKMRDKALSRRRACCAREVSVWTELRRAHFGLAPSEPAFSAPLLLGHSCLSSPCPGLSPQF